uniref:Uncharacterized protein n=1 Tax=Anopheles farauti TaxID=69004 RepID=A0A182Q717_9DIPT
MKNFRNRSAIELDEIYREIKSNSRAVAACIRSYERDRKSASSATGGNKGSLTPEVEASLGSNTNSGHNSSSVVQDVTDGKGKENGGGGGCGVKGLERRYHLLYLKAFEIQCLLEGLLDSKTSSSDNNASLSDTDEEPANKLARVSSSSTKSQGSTHNETLNNAAEVSAIVAATTVLKENILNNNNSLESGKSIIGCDLVDGAALLSSTLDTVNNNANTNVNGSALVKDHTTERRLSKGSSLRNVKSSSPIGSNGKQKRSKVSDSSKFNRSNRKSKNCATFYFKHLDTDSELNKDSSERTKSDESSPGTSSPSASSSEGDDEWVYNNGEEEDEEDNDLLAVRKRNDAAAGEEEKENKPDAQQVHAEELVTSPLKMTASRELKSKKCLDFSREGMQKAGSGSATPGRNGGRSLMMTSIGSFGKSSDSVNSAKGSKTSTLPGVASATAHSSQHHHHHHHHGHGRKAEKAMSNLKMNLIEEWLEKQPLDAPVGAPLLPASVPTTDCEASGEYTDSDSIARDTDSSEGLANSVATCLQGEQTQTSQELLNDGTSYPSENSNDVSNDDEGGVTTDSKGGTAPQAGVTAASSNPSLPTSTAPAQSSSVSTVVKRRPHRSAADRPWSVSCMSQLNSSTVEINQYGGGGGGGSGTSGAGSGEGSAADGMMKKKDGNDSGGGSSSNNNNPRQLTDHRNFSISESALNTMSRSSMVGSRGSMKPTTSQQTVVRNSESKGSLKKRKLRPRRKNRIDESGSDESQPPAHSSSTLHSLLLQYNTLTGGSGGQPLRELQLSGTGGSNSSVAGAGGTSGSRRLLKSESFSGRLRLSDDLLTLSSLSGSSSRKSSSVRQTTAVATRSTRRSQDSEEEFGGTMAKPEFRIGSMTRARCGSLNLGSLAALANYNLDGVEKAETDLNGTGTGTEEMSSFSEQAWDNYQEKYMSEPYSEDRDTDAARRLLDFGDDYRNFIDSQSDCASSSLSAANMDSLSPPRFRLKSESANKSETNANSLNRRKRLDEYRMDDRYGNNMNSWSSKSGSPPQSTTNANGRKHGSLSFLEATPLASMAETTPVLNGGNVGLGAAVGGGVRRRSLRSVDKHNASSAAFVRSVSHETSSSSNNEFDEDMEAEVKKLLIQSKIRFANTEALKAKCHLLKPDDYSEIITTCRENVRCLESVLRCQPGTVLTAAKCQDLRGKRTMHRAQSSSPSSSNAYAEDENEDEHDSDYSDSDDSSTISCCDTDTDSTDSCASTLGRQSELGDCTPQPWSRCVGQRGCRNGGPGKVQSLARHSENRRRVNGGQDSKEQWQENERPISPSGGRAIVRARSTHRKRKKVVVVREECRCARITRFIAWLIEFLLDIGNVVRNFTLYRFFVGVLNGFYRLVDFFGRDRKTNAPAANTPTTAAAAAVVSSGSESGMGSLTSVSATFATTKALARGADDILKRLTIGII